MGAAALVERNQDIFRELDMASAARDGGRLGLARVCARRAAGWAIRDHYQARGIRIETPSALEAIRAMLEMEGLPPEVRTVLDHLVLKVTKDSPDEESYWPLENDLVEEARWLIEGHFGMAR